MEQNPREQMELLGKSYAKGAYMYEHSKIAKNQMDAINLRVYAIHSGWDEKMTEQFERLKKEADKMVQDPELVEEYTKAEIEAEKLFS